MFKRIITYSILTLVALGGFFGNVDIETNGNNIGVISYEGVSYTYAFECQAGMQETANGQGCEKIPSSSASVEMYNKLIDTINIALAVLSAIISPIILFVGWLMSPDWTSGDLFGLREPMYKLWITVSNIVYFIYAILLILIALGTMFGQDKFSYKVMLPKLALGILMVPFTWWFVQWTISIASVVTASVMTIPAETIARGDSAWFNNPSIPKIMSIDNTGTGTDSNIIDCSIYPSECQSPKKFLEKSGGMYGPLIVYGYSIFKFEKINRLDPGLDYAKAALQLVHTSIVSTIMFAVFGLLTLALAAMLLVRAIKLWMYAIFAPLFTFRFVAGSNLMGGDDDSFSIKEFIGLAFVPAIVGLTLSFGLIIINAVHGPGSTKATTTAGQECDLNPAGGKPCVIGGILGNPANSITRTIENFGTKDAYTRTVFKYADIQFLFLGKATNQTDSKSTASGALSSLGGMFGTLIVDVIALVFIWMAFMAAKNVSKAVKMAVQPFEDIGNKIGGLAKSIPKYTPLPGIGMSTNSMGKVVTNAENAMIGASDKRFKESPAGKLFGGERVVATVDEKKLSDALKDANRSSHNGFKVAGDQIEKQTGKDIEYSSMFKDLIGSLKQFTDRSEKIRALETAGYSNDNAKKIVDQLMNKTNNEFDKNNVELMTGLKSRIGTPVGGTAGGAGGNTISKAELSAGSTSAYNINIQGKPVNFTLNDQGKKITDIKIDGLKDLKNIMTEEDLLKSLQTDGKLTQEAAKVLTKEIHDKYPDFIKKP